jgi:serine/threonine protein kinase
MSDSSSDRDPVEMLAEEFIARKRRGEKPSLTEYLDRYPHLANDIRELFPALLMMEDLGDSALGSTGPHLGSVPTLKQLGDYRILREVGRGGMGIVYEAEQQSLGRRVALKVLPPHTLNDASHVRRFEREARAAARLHHTNIVPVYGVGHQEGTHFYVMQFIAGLGLDGVLKELRQLRATRVNPPTVGTVPPAVRQVAYSLVTGSFHQAAP